MKYKYFRVIYPRGAVLIMKARSYKTLTTRLPLFSDVKIEEVSPRRTGLKRTLFEPAPRPPPPPGEEYPERKKRIPRKPVTPRVGHRKYPKTVGKLKPAPRKLKPAPRPWRGPGEEWQ